MKNIYFLKAIFTLILCGFFSITYAGTIYLSATGSDLNDGLTTGTAVKSFSVAHTLASAGDTIMVSGMIDFTIDPANTFTPLVGGLFSTSNKAGIVVTKSLNIHGTSATTDGFDGTNLTTFNTSRFLQMLTDVTLGLKNLTLKNGNVVSDLVTNGGGAIVMYNGNIVAENVIFDNNTLQGSQMVGGALDIKSTNVSGSTFKNCVFNANLGEKAGAIYFTSWAANSTILFENCAFTGNVANGTFGGSALYIRANTSANTTFNIINCTFKGNTVNGSPAVNGGTIYTAKAPNTTNINIVNCTITGNTTASAAGNGAGIVHLNSVTNSWANLYITNCIIEGNTTTAGVPSDLQVAAVSPAVPGTGSSTIPGFIKIQNSIIGAVTSDPLRIPTATNIVASPSFNYLTATSTSADYIAKLAPFDSTTNSFSLMADSPAIGYASTLFLTSLIPAVTKDQLGNTRPAPLCSAGSVEANPVLGLKKNLENSMMVYRNANNQITVENTKTDFTGSITVYNTIGQIVAKKLVNGAITTIDKPLNSGVYIVMLSNVAGSSSKKVIIN